MRLTCLLIACAFFALTGSRSVAEEETPLAIPTGGATSNASPEAVPSVAITPRGQNVVTRMTSGVRVDGVARSYYFGSDEKFALDGPYLIAAAYGTRWIFSKTIDVVDIATGTQIRLSGRFDDVVRRMRRSHALHLIDAATDLRRESAPGSRLRPPHAAFERFMGICFMLQAVVPDPFAEHDEP